MKFSDAARDYSIALKFQERASAELDRIALMQARLDQADARVADAGRQLDDLWLSAVVEHHSEGEAA